MCPHGQPSSVFCRSASRHIAPLTAQSPGMQCLCHFEPQVSDTVPTEWNIPSTTLNLCHTVTTFCDGLRYVLIKQCVWVFKYWYHCYSNLDLPSGSMYHSFLNNYAQKSSIGLFLERTWIYDFLCLADPPQWTTTFPDSEWMLRLQSKSGAHLASLTSYIQFLQPWIWCWCGLKNITDTWKTLCDTEQKKSAPLLNTISKSSLKPVKEPVMYL